MKKKISIIAKDFFELLIKDNINAYASSTAFFIFLSFIPMLLLIFSILPYTPVSQTDFIDLLLNFIPPSLQEGMIHMVTEIYEKSVSTISFAAIITLWSAAKGVLALMRGLNAVHDVNEKKGYFRLRLKALLYTLIFLVAIITSLVFMFFGKTLSSMIVEDYPKLSFLFQVLLQVRFLFNFLILVFVFLVMYEWIPNKKLNFKFQIPGALFSAVAWSVFSFLFSIYITRFHAFNMYGSFAIIISLMLWLYICMYLLLIGANMNRYFKPALDYLYEKRRMKKDNA